MHCQLKEFMLDLCSGHMRKLPIKIETAKVEKVGNVCTVTLPEKCSYTVLRFYK